MINDLVRVSTRTNRQVAAILSATLFNLRPTKPISELGREFDKINPYIKFGRNLMKNDQFRVTTTTDDQTDGRTG